MKRGKLSKAELFVIESMYKEGKTTEEIASFLDRSVKSVVAALPEPTEEPVSEKPKGYVTMTAAQSERADELRKQRVNPVSDLYSSITHRIK